MATPVRRRGLSKSLSSLRQALVLARRGLCDVRDSLVIVDGL